MSDRSTALILFAGLLFLVIYNWSGEKQSPPDVTTCETMLNAATVRPAPYWIRDTTWHTAPPAVSGPGDNMQVALAHSESPELPRLKGANGNRRKLQSRYSPIPKYVPELNAIVINGYTYPLHVREPQPRQEDTGMGEPRIRTAPGIATVLELHRTSVRVNSGGDTVYVSRLEIIRKYAMLPTGRTQYDSRNQHRIYQAPLRPAPAVPTVPEKYRTLLAVKSADFR